MRGLRKAFLRRWHCVYYRGFGKVMGTGFLNPDSNVSNLLVLFAELLI